MPPTPSTVFISRKCVIVSLVRKIHLIVTTSTTNYFYAVNLCFGSYRTGTSTTMEPPTPPTIFSSLACEVVVSTANVQFVINTNSIVPSSLSIASFRSSPCGQSMTPLKIIYLYGPMMNPYLFEARKFR